jgi:glutamate dehydrogenase (NADP+)
VLLSGAGNVALHCAGKLLEMGATVLTLSDSDGVIFSEDGLASRQLEWLSEARRDGARMGDFAAEFDLDYRSGEKPWQFDADIAVPCATQNELDETDAEALLGHDVAWVAEGANMPLSSKAMALLRKERVKVCPGKAANAGGVAVSALEMSQNAAFRPWTQDQVENSLDEIMARIHRSCLKHLDEDAGVDYVCAANRAGFERVAAAMLAQGPL